MHIAKLFKGDGILWKNKPYRPTFLIALITCEGENVYYKSSPGIEKLKWE